MSLQFSIRVYKQYFNFAAAHFMIFQDGSREPLHGHNYRVEVKGLTPKLSNDMVFDFLNIKPIVREICNECDHRLLIPKENAQIRIDEQEQQTIITTPDGSFFSFPKQDVLLLPIENTSAERLAIYISEQIQQRLFQKYSFHFETLEVEVEETPGQSASYSSRNEK